MNFLSSISKKRDGGVLSKDTIFEIVQDYTKGVIPDYQMSAFLMAVLFKGMNSGERAALTQAMIGSGNTIEFPNGRPLVDKHSTGGVGDKVSIILAPILAATDFRVPMISGRSLGHTGGTLDKLDSIPNYNTSLTEEQFVTIVEKTGYAMMGQTDSVAPADKKMYALRDATATVESIPLICSSILSKKFAEGCEHLVLDVKCGKGAFMKTIDDARNLGKALLETGRAMGKSIGALITNMDAPLGYAVGNFLEIEECISILDPQRDIHPLSTGLVDLSIALCVHAVRLAYPEQKPKDIKQKLRQVLIDGSAYRAFLDNVSLQGGDVELLQTQVGTKRSLNKTELRSDCEGYVVDIDALSIANTLRNYGAGRQKTEDTILPYVGLELHVGVGSEVKKDVVATVWTERPLNKSDAHAIRSAITYDKNAPEKQNIVFEEL